ncbi:MAG: tetratricopeptide repeat protein [bacterium]|nr:tetratricopeptide repeat protein [bacterium]
MRKKKLKSLFLLLSLILPFFACNQAKELNQDLLQAEKFYSEQLFSEAAKVYERLLSRYPESDRAVEIGLRLATVYQYNIQDSEKALEAYLWVIRHFPKKTETVMAYEKRIEIFKGRQEYGSAVEEYNNLLRLNFPEIQRDRYRYEQASCHLKAKDLHQARESLQRFLKEFPKSEWSDEALLDLGETFFLQNEFKPAEEAYRSLVQKYPQSPLLLTARFNRALSLEEMGEWNQSLRIYEEILPEYPNRDLIESKIKKLRERQEKTKRG